MALSPRFNTLKARVNQIENHLLPTINPTGMYTDKDQDLTRSYCILCHAEIEAYIEDIVRATTKASYDKWMINKHKIHPIIFHLAYNYKQESGKPKEPPYAMVTQSFRNINKAIDKNNGIKEENINQLTKPIGFEVDNTLATTLSSFGRTRGDIAHQSFQTQQPLDPITQKNNIKNILIGLEDFDMNLSDYEVTGNISNAPFNLQWSKPSITVIITKAFRRFFKR
jgi:hypothetical protein